MYFEYKYDTASKKYLNTNTNTAWQKAFVFKIQKYDTFPVKFQAFSGLEIIRYNDDLEVS